MKHCKQKCLRYGYILVHLNSTSTPLYRNRTGLIHKTKITNPDNHSKHITHGTSHKLFIEIISSKDTDEKNPVQNKPPFDHLKKDTHLRQGEEKSYFPTLDLQSFRLGLIRKLSDIREIVLSRKNNSLENKPIIDINRTMWNSRNRILIDTDGDDVAFLSGSGRNRTKKYIF